MDLHCGCLDWFQMTLYKRVLVNITKQMKKAPIWRCIFLYQYLILKTSPVHLAPILFLVGLGFLTQCRRINVHRPFVSFFGFGSYPKTLSLVRTLNFLFILIHTQVICVRNYYIIIFTMKNHHYIWMYILNCFIGLLFYFYFKLTITYNDSTYLFLILYTTICQQTRNIQNYYNGL